MLFGLLDFKIEIRTIHLKPIRSKDQFSPT